MRFRIGISCDWRLLELETRQKDRVYTLRERGVARGVSAR